MQKERLLFLLNKYQTGSCTEQEFQELEAWYGTLNENEQAFEGREAIILSKQMLSEFKRRLKDKELIKAPVVSVRKYRWLRVGSAAAIIGFLCTGIYLFVNHENKPAIAKVQKAPSKNDVAPGGNKAILTLADGSAIALDSAANGAIAQQGNTKIIKLDSGQLAYNNEQSTVNGGQLTVQYNTVSTPRGGQYQIVLADGSKVWLNAASSLKYPTVFKGDERNVELTGEAYFEVAHNAAMPFHVNVNGMTVEVLGTHFDVMAYGDEDAVKTTLLEGAVRVMNGPSSMIKLVPGQQAQLNKNGELKLVQDADVDKEVAWKNGWFEFDDTELPVIMRQISRWYDVDIDYETLPTKEKFGGRISKNLPLSSILHLLESNGVQFKQDGKKLIVQP